MHEGFTAAVQRSEPILVDGTWTALTLSGDATSNTATVSLWDFSDAGWGRSGDQIPLGYFADGDGEVAPTSDWTGDDVPDVLFEVFGNDPHGMVITNHTGTWAPATFRHSWGDDDGSEGLHAEGRDLVSYTKDCDPSCADGAVTELIWAWDDNANVFAIASSTELRAAEPAAPPPHSAAAAAGSAAEWLGLQSSEVSCVQDTSYPDSYACTSVYGDRVWADWKGDGTWEVYYYG